MVTVVSNPFSIHHFVEMNFFSLLTYYIMEGLISLQSSPIFLRFEERKRPIHLLFHNQSSSSM